MKKYRILLLTALTVFLFTTPAAAQRSEKTTVFKGKVTRSDTRQAVAKVQIRLTDEKKSGDREDSVETETDDEGRFVFSGLRPGKYTISIRAVFDREEDVPCRLLMGRIDEPNSQLLVITENGKKIEQIFIKGFAVKAGREITREFDLVCRSLFGQ